MTVEELKTLSGMPLLDFEVESINKMLEAHRKGEGLIVSEGTRRKRIPSLQIGIKTDQVYFDEFINGRDK